MQPTVTNSDSGTSTVTDWDPDRYAQHARFVSDYGRSLIDWLQPQPGERILDLGCGDGVLTATLKDLGCRVVGVDASARQVDAARRKGLTALVCNGEDLPFSRQFDAVFSNAALHWMRRPDAVLAGVSRSLKSKGRFVAEFGGAGNVAAITNALRQSLKTRGYNFEQLSPWYFPEPEEYGQKLKGAGFDILAIEKYPRPTPLPSDIIGWLETFAQSFTIGWSPADRTALFSDVREQLRPQLCSAEGQWTADYVRLRFVAVKQK
ncbi:methyltransferase domain-containing protein [bacterium]|nr:methyltransferase domain-containing protein [bacterium]